MEMERVRTPGLGGRRGLRANVTLGLIAVLCLAELVLGVIVYCSPRDFDLALAASCGGVVAFAVIDRWPRPHSERTGARRLRCFLPIWCLVPFLCALGSLAWVDYQQ